MTGCPNSCARPETAELAFVGRMPGFYNIYVGANRAGTRMNNLLLERIAMDKLSSHAKQLFSIYKEKRQKGEAFGDFCHRFGIENLKN
jgi:sulfite reductase (ferredoxin)